MANIIRSIKVSSIRPQWRNVRTNIDVAHEDANDEIGASSFLYSGCIDAVENITTGATQVKEVWPFDVWTNQGFTSR